MNRITDVDWFERHPLLVAFDLIGCTVSVERDGVRASGRIVEVEAYAGLEDLASHAAIYPSKREFLFGEPGRLYMYRAYGIHSMLNVIAHDLGDAGAVLIRAAEPLEGLDTMRIRRGVKPERLLMSGPGKVTQALGLTLEDQLKAITVDDEIALYHALQPVQIIAGQRIGITRSVDAPWRLFDAESVDVSAHRRGNLIQLSELALHHHISLQT